MTYLCYISNIVKKGKTKFRLLNICIAPSLYGSMVFKKYIAYWYIPMKSFTVKEGDISLQSDRNASSNFYIKDRIYEIFAYFWQKFNSVPN